MRVLVVAYKFGTTEEIGKELGSYSYFLDQLEELKKQGVELAILAPWVSWFDKGSKVVRGIPVIRYWPKLAARSLRNVLLYKFINKLYIWRTRKLIENLAPNFDLIYVRQARETGYAVAKASMDIPKVFQPITTWRWHFEETGDSWFKRIVKDTDNQKNYAQYLLKNFDYFITYNKSMAEEYISLGAERLKFEVIPGAVDHDLFKPVERTDQNTKTILYIGRINFAEKGIGYLLQAFEEVKKQVPEAKLVLIGPGTPEEINKLELNDDIEYLGAKKYEELPTYINSASVGVVPSVWFESSGRVSLDMLSCGLPVVVTDTGGLPEYSIDGRTSFVVPSKNSEALAEALIKILSDDNLRKVMSQNARRHILENYTFQRTTEKFIKFFEKVCAA